MNESRRLFLQILLIVLALIFLFTVKYVYENKSAQAGAFGTGENMNNVTISEAFSAIFEGGEE